MPAQSLPAEAFVLVRRPPTDSFQGPQSASAPPTHRVDAAWPRTLPDNWVLGQVSGLAVDSRDHVWILHRPLSIPKPELNANWCHEVFNPTAASPRLNLCEFTRRCIPSVPRPSENVVT